MENLKRKIHALVTRKARVLARVITRALECGRRTPFEACRQCRTLLSTQNFQQVLQFVLPTEHGMRVRVGLDVASRHARHLNFFSTRQKHNCGAANERRDVQKSVNRPWSRVIAVAVRL